jgi:VWFA-related protein
MTSLLLNRSFLRLFAAALALGCESVFMHATAQVPQSGLVQPQAIDPQSNEYYARARSVIGWDSKELLRFFPELKTLHLEPNNGQLETLLPRVGTNVDAMFRHFFETASVEKIVETRLGAGGILEGARSEKFEYLARPRQDSAGITIDENRTDEKGKQIHSRDTREFFVTSGFASMALHFHPVYQAQSNYRYLGRQVITDREVFVIGFAQRPGAAQLLGRIGLGQKEASVLYQGVAWIDSVNYQIIRIRAELLAPRPDLLLERQTTAVDFRPQQFQTTGVTLWLPDQATVTIVLRGSTFQNVHRYSHYRLFNVQAKLTMPAQPPDTTEGNTASSQRSNEAEPEELVALGITSLQANKRDEAVGKFHDALHVDPENVQAHYWLGVTLSGDGNWDGAIAEFRDAIHAKPDFEVAHNYLGTLLFRKQDLIEAVAEFREAIRLKSDYAAAHYNLGVVLEKLGDHEGGSEHLTIAYRLAPDNATFRRKYESLAAPASSSRSELPRKSARAKEPASPGGDELRLTVEVKEVLLPVFVRDRKGRQVAGLPASDFQIFEDDVPQDILAFSVQSDASVIDAGIQGQATDASSNHGKGARSSSASWRTYLICVDTLNSKFANLARVRISLAKLFEQEKSANSQYVLMTLGQHGEIVQSVTRDPAVMLSAIESKAFQKAMQQSTNSNVTFRKDEITRLLDEYRSGCSGTPGLGCTAKKDQLRARANGAAGEISASTQGFLRELQAVVEQLARMPTARTLVLITDGFGLLPGRELFATMAAYFPKDHWELSAGDNLQSQLDAILQLAAEKNVVVYSVDARGVDSATGGFEDASNSPGAVPASDLMPAIRRAAETAAWDNGSPMAQLARATGGMDFHDSNDLLKGIQQAFLDGRQYYLLSYVSRNSSTDGTFRKISVRVRNKELLVRTKNGYWASGR